MGELAGVQDGNNEPFAILNRVKRGFRKRHAYVLAAVVLVVVLVLVAVLVPVLLHARDARTRDEQQKVSRWMHSRAGVMLELLTSLVCRHHPTLAKRAST